MHYCKVGHTAPRFDCRECEAIRAVRGAEAIRAAHYAKTRVIHAGTVVKIGGFPVRLLGEVRAESHPENWSLIDHELTHTELGEPTSPDQ